MTPDTLPPTLCPPPANDDVPAPPPMNDAEQQRKAKTRRTMPPVELSLANESSGPSWASQIPPSSTQPPAVPHGRTGTTLPPLALSLDETELYEPSQSMSHSSALPKARNDSEISFLPPVFVDAFSGPHPLETTRPTPAAVADSPLADWEFEVVSHVSATPQAADLSAEEDSGGFRFQDPEHGARNRSEIELTGEAYSLWDSYDAPAPGSLPNGDEVFFDGPVRLIESGTHKVAKHRRVLRRKPLLNRRLALMATGASLGIFGLFSVGLDALRPAGQPTFAYQHEGTEAATQTLPIGADGEAIGGLAASSGHLLVVATPESDLDKPVKRPDAITPQPETQTQPNAVQASPGTPAQKSVPQETVAGSPPSVTPALATAAPAVDNSTKLKVEWGRITLPMTEGRVARAFTLNGPPRVVVDLEGTSAPPRLEEQVGEKGIARVRTGRPDAEHLRVVVELSGKRKPTRPSTLMRDGELAIAWR